MSSSPFARHDTVIEGDADDDAIDGRDLAIADAERELTLLNGQVASMKGLLVDLYRDVAQAQRRLDQVQAGQLLEANERLVVAALGHQADAEAAQRALSVATHLAERDALTQLPNRRLMLARFGQAVTMARRHGTRMAVIYLDIDHFKQINDRLGHAVGDQVLQRVAHCLVGSVREADTVCRLGGDEFVIVLSEITQASDVAPVAANVMATLAAPCRVGDHLLDLSASIGISVYPDDGEDADNLLKKADAAMYRAKRHGPGSYAYHGVVPAFTC